MNTRKLRARKNAVAGIKNLGIAFFAGASLVLLLAGCSPAAATRTAASTATEMYRATPESEFPAAGICASFNEETIQVEIRDWPGSVPDPRCIQVRADQNLIIRNSAPAAITFRLGMYHAAIQPGSAYPIEPAFGEYLLPGAHSLHIDPYGGPEIFYKVE